MVATNLFNNALRVDLDEYLRAATARRRSMSEPARSPCRDGRAGGQVAFITGAAHGQGRATALALAREGVAVAALDVARPLAYPGYAMGSSDELDIAGRRLPDGWASSA